MLSRPWLYRMALAIGLVGACLKPAGARADEWGRYYHWPYSNFQQYYWTPYEYEQVYDYRYRYPAQLRVYPQVDKWRNWLYVKKPYYRGYHFVLDQF